MALPSLSAAFGFPTPLHLTDGAGGVSEGVTSYAASHCPFSQPTLSSTLQLSPRPSNDGDFDHDVHSDCSSNSKYKLRRDGRGTRDGTLVAKLHCLPTGNGERRAREEGREALCAVLGLFCPSCASV